jgi:4'-phosphopantetheinyl transferase EntD
MDPQVSWHFVQRRAPAAFVDEGGRHLTPREQRRLADFPVEKRRSEWLGGRLAAKELVCKLVQDRFGVRIPLAAIEVWHGSNGAPIVLSADGSGALPFLPGEALPLELSLSHSRGAALCGAFWKSENTSARSLGVDVEAVETRAPDLFDDYFTPPEHQYCNEGPIASRDERATLVWSAKESVLKATGLGLRTDTRALTCLPDLDSRPVQLTIEPAAGWRPLLVTCEPPLADLVTHASGCWLARDGFVLTVVVIR